MPDRNGDGPGRSLESIEAEGQTEDLLRWLARYGRKLWEFRAKLGMLETSKASAIIQAIGRCLGPTLSHFEIDCHLHEDEGGLNATMLSSATAGLRLLSNLELPLAGQLTDTHLRALANAQPTRLRLLYPSKLHAAANSFSYTKEGWSSFEHMSDLNLVGGHVCHTWGMADAPINKLLLGHGSQLSLEGLKTSTSLTSLTLQQPDLQHSSESPWFQQLQPLSGLKSLVLVGRPSSSAPNISATVMQLFHLSHLHHLGIYDWSPADIGLHLADLHVPDCPQLKTLHISGSLKWPFLNFEALSSLRSLTLRLPAVMLPGSLSNLVQLTLLDISRSSNEALSPLNVSVIGHLVALVTLYLDNCRELEFDSDAAWLTLAMSPALQRVGLTGSRPASDQISWLAMANFMIAVKGRNSVPDLPSVELFLG